MQPSSENLKIIRFENEMLPNWAQLLDLAARLSHVSESTRGWFSRFTHTAGVDDVRIIISECQTLLTTIRRDSAALVLQLERKRGDSQAPQIVAAWEYALETMILESHARKTCSWQIEGPEEKGESDFGGGGITLRRI